MPENDLFDIKKRLTAAAQIRKITRTMELIASSRLQRAKTLVAGAEEWLKHMREAAQCLPDSYFKPLSGAKKGNKAYVVFGGSKGLSGAYGPNLLNYAKPIVNGHIVIAVGSATQKFFKDAYLFLGDDIPCADYAETVAQAAKSLYESKEVDEVGVIYTRGSEHVAERLFPPIRKGEYDNLVIVEPSAKALFPALFEEYVKAIVYEAHLQAFVSEQIARVSAMDNATKNADEIIETLQATYNRIRQSSITQEINSVGNAKRKGNR